MPVFAWAALGVAILAVAGGKATAVTSGLRAWRAFRHSRRTVLHDLEDLTRRVGGLEARVARANEGVQRLGVAQAQLQESLATAGVIASAASDARSLLRVLGFLRR